MLPPSASQEDVDLIVVVFIWNMMIVIDHHPQEIQMNNLEPLFSATLCLPLPPSLNFLFLCLLLTLETLSHIFSPSDPRPEI